MNNQSQESMDVFLKRAKLTPEEIKLVLEKHENEEFFRERGKPKSPEEAIAEAQLNKLLNQPLYFKIEKPLPECDEYYRGLIHTGYRMGIEAMLQREKESYIPTGGTK